MIPRTKVNYRFADLFRAMWTSESAETYRSELQRLLVQALNCPDVLLTASGRGALYILLKCLPQQRVFIPAYTCKAVVEAASLAGKQIEFVESETDGFNMNVDELDGRLGPHTIVIATHQFGIPCKIDRIVEMARQAGAFVIEDAAASLGGKINGRSIGTFGDAAFFSFDSTKLINVPLKGGFLIAQDAELAMRCRSFVAEQTRAMPMARKWNYLMMGSALVALEQPVLYRLFHNLKFHWRNRFTDDSETSNPYLGPFYKDRLSEWQARVLIPQIKSLEKYIAKRQQIYRKYHKCLEGRRGLLLPPHDSASEWAPIRFPIRVHVDKLRFYREAARKGVDFAFSFTFLASPAAFKRSHHIAATVLDLPFYDRLTDRELEKTVKIIRTIDATVLTGD